MRQHELIIIIPARSGSKGIKNKNIISIKNKPLVYYSIKAAKKFKCKNKLIFCSTDSNKIKKICNKFRINIPFLRTKDISGDTSRDISFVNQTLKNFYKIGDSFKYGLILRPTSPKRDIRILQKAYLKFKKNKSDSLRSIVESPYPVHKLWFLKKNLIVPVIKTNIHEHYNAPRQILRKTYAQSGNFEFFRVNYKKKIKSISGKKISYFITPKNLENDIDNINDLKKIKL